MRKVIFFILFFVIGLFYLFEIDELIARKFTFFHDIKVTYIDKIINLSHIAESHFKQVETIKALKKENEELKKYKILSIDLENQLNMIKNLLVALDNKDLKPKIDLVKVISYTNYNDFTKVYLDKKKDNDKILGLISQNYAAGIVVNRNNREVALLNGNKETSYAVFIGEEKIPGIITSHKDGKNMLIKYIPIGSKIEVGQLVVTSGMDNVFFEGLKVGKITSVTSLPDMEMATVKPFAKVLDKRFFFTYEYIEKKNSKKIKKSKKKRIKKTNKKP